MHQGHACGQLGRNAGCRHPARAGASIGLVGGGGHDLTDGFVGEPCDVAER